MTTRELMELASAAPLPAPKEKHWTRELMELRQAWAWALPSVKRSIRRWTRLAPVSANNYRYAMTCRRLLEIVEK